MISFEAHSQEHLSPVQTFPVQIYFSEYCAFTQSSLEAHPYEEIGAISLLLIVTGQIILTLLNRVLTKPRLWDTGQKRQADQRTFEHSHQRDIQ